MATSMREEIKVGPLAIRFLVEGEQSGGSVAVFEFDVPAGIQVAAAHSHDGYEETIYGLEGVLTWTVEAGRSRSSLRECSDPTTSRGRPSSMRRRAGRPPSCNSER